MYVGDQGNIKREICKQKQKDPRSLSVLSNSRMTADTQNVMESLFSKELYCCGRAKYAVTAVKAPLRLVPLWGVLLRSTVNKED